MFIEMSCQCGALLQLDGVNESFTMVTAVRFTEAHVKCGFVTPTKRDEPERTVRREIDLTIATPKDDED